MLEDDDPRNYQDETRSFIHESYNRRPSTQLCEATPHAEEALLKEEPLISRSRKQAW